MSSSLLKHYFLITNPSVFSWSRWEAILFPFLTLIWENQLWVSQLILRLLFSYLLQWLIIGSIIKDVKLLSSIIIIISYILVINSTFIFISRSQGGYCKSQSANKVYIDYIYWLKVKPLPNLDVWLQMQVSNRQTPSYFFLSKNRSYKEVGPLSILTWYFVMYLTVSAISSSNRSMQ